MFQRPLPNVACILKCTYYSITFGFLKDGPADLWLLQRQPLPGRCQSLAATSSILLTLGRGPERAISQTSGHCIRRPRRLWILRTLHIFQSCTISRSLEWLKSVGTGIVLVDQRLIFLTLQCLITHNFNNVPLFGFLRIIASFLTKDKSITGMSNWFELKFNTSYN